MPSSSRLLAESRAELAVVKAALAEALQSRDAALARLEKLDELISVADADGECTCQIDAHDFKCPVHG